MAGIAAALAAARQGKKTVLFERQFLLGGLGTAGIVTIFLPLCDGFGHQVSRSARLCFCTCPFLMVRKADILTTG